MPSGEFSRPTGPRKPRVVDKGKAKSKPAPPPRTDVQSGGGYKIPRKAPKPPAPSFGRPLGAVPIKPPARKTTAPKPVKYRGKAPTYAQSPETVVREDRRRRTRESQTARNARVAEQARIAVGTFIGPLRPRVELSDSHRVPTSAPLMRDSGVANNSAPQVRGVSLSPQRIARDMALIQRQAPGMGRIVERLRAAGIADAPPTGLERREEEAAFRRLLEAQAWELQRLQNSNDGNIAIGAREFRDRIRRVSTEDLAARVADLSRPENLQKMGFDPTSLGGLILGTAQGLGDAAREVTGSTLLGNAAHDLLMYPTWAIPAAYQAATDPEAFVEGLSQGVIGHAVRGDWKGARQAFEDHPVFSLAEVRGGKALVARGIGGLARAVPGPSRRLAQTGGRLPVALDNTTGTRNVFLRSYSKDPTVKAAQVLADRALSRGPDVQLPGGRRSSSVLLQSGLPGAQRLGVNRGLEALRSHRAARAMDVGQSAAVSLQQADRAANIRLAEKGAPSLRRGSAEELRGGIMRMLAARFPQLTAPERQLVSMALRGEIRRELVAADGTRSRATPQTLKADLLHMADRLRAQRETGTFRSGREVEANRRQESELRSMAANPKVLRRVGRVLSSQEKLAPVFARQAQEAERLRALAEEAGDRAPLFPFAIVGSPGTELEFAL